MPFDSRNSRIGAKTLVYRLPRIGVLVPLLSGNNPYKLRDSGSNTTAEHISDNRGSLWSLVQILSGLSSLSILSVSASQIFLIENVFLALQLDAKQA